MMGVGGVMPLFVLSFLWSRVSLGLLPQKESLNRDSSTGETPGTLIYGEGRGSTCQLESSITRGSSSLGVSPFPASWKATPGDSVVALRDGTSIPTVCTGRK